MTGSKSVRTRTDCSVATEMSRWGHLEIARRFNAGKLRAKGPSPEGTAAFGRPLFIQLTLSAVPSGLMQFQIVNPALKRRAISNYPFGIKEARESWKNASWVGIRFIKLPPCRRVPNQKNCFKRR
jgi:hypothetical protein